MKNDTSQVSLSKALKYHKKGDLVNAENYYVNAINESPDDTNSIAYCQLGIIYQQKKDSQNAELFFSKAIEIDPRYREAYENLANLYLEHNLLEEAKICLEKIIKINPNISQVYKSLGNIFFHLDNLSDAKINFEKAISLDANNYEAYNSLGSCYQYLNDIDKAKENYKKALNINPRYISSLYNLSYIYLIEKDYIKGFKQFRHRYNKAIRGNKLGGVAYPPTLLTPKDEVANKTVYISHEQGLGDTLQFIRFLPFFIEKKAKLICYVPPSLKKLFELNYPDVEFILPGNDIAFDYNFPMLESPYLLGTTYENIPFSQKYLSVDKDDVLVLKNKYNIQEKRINIGINYKGSQGPDAVKNRSINLELILKNLSDLNEDIQIYSVQFERTKEEDKLLEKYSVINLGKDIKSFYDTALMIDAMDIMISIDTSVLHLCGALGKETIALLKFSPDWRWDLNSNKTKWYDSITTIRQKAPGDWESTFAELIQALKDKMNGL